MTPSARSRLLKMLPSVLLLAGAIVQLAIIRLAGDDWWLGTVLMFAPRWPLLGPIAVVAGAHAVMRSKKWLTVDAFSAAIVLAPTMGWNPPALWASGNQTGVPLRVMSLNAGGGTKLELIRRQIAEFRPDVVALQETPSGLPQNLFDARWNVVRTRGLTIASRLPVIETDVFEGHRVGSWFDPGLRARVRTPDGDVWVTCVYMESPRSGFEELTVTEDGVFGIDAVQENTERRGVQSSKLSLWAAKVEGPVVIAGDFNQPPESHFFHRDWSAFQDAFLTASGGYGYTWFSSWHGLRIDRILTDDAWQVKSFEFGARAGGDHRPVVAELRLIDLIEARD